MSQQIRIHTSQKSAEILKAVGEVLIVASWKQTQNQERKERAVLIPMECVKAPDVLEQFRPLVEAVLLKQAEESLKSFVNGNPNSMELSSNVFSRPQLCEDFLSSGSGWMSKEALEQGWNASATWKRITNRSEFQTNALYRKQAEVFKDAILKMSGKATAYSAEKCDLILSKLEPDDLATEMGGFIVRRIQQMKTSQPPEDFSSI